MASESALNTDWSSERSLHWRRGFGPAEATSAAMEGAVSATLQLEPFNPATDCWSQWEERLQYFIECNGIQGEGKKRATLLTVCGKEAFSLICSLIAPSKTSEKSFDELLQVIRDHKDPKPSIIVSRFKFSSCHRAAGQSVADYVSLLRKATEHCCFGSTLDDRLTEQFVCGIRDPRMQRRLLSEISLDFASAQKLCLAIEASSRDAHLMSGTAGAGTSAAGTAEVCEVRAQGSPTGRPAVRCWRCGGRSHSPDVCRFASYKCHKCSKTGHLAKMCTAKHTPARLRRTQGRANAVEAAEDWETDCAAEDGLAGQAEEVCRTEAVHRVSVPPISCRVEFQGTNVDMEIDTGSSVSLIGQDTFERLRSKPDLRSCSARFKTYTGQFIPVLGEFRTVVTYEGVPYRDMAVVVVKGAKTNLLGRDWLEHITINWRAVHAIRSSSLQSLKEKHRRLFEPGLGELKGVKVRLDIDRTVSPRFCKARSLPYVFKEKVEAQLQKDIDSGVLEEVQNSSWAAPIVPVLKKDGSVRVCGNFKLTANRAVRLDRYPLPQVPDLFATLAGGTVFSKIDLAQAYNQLVIHEDSQDILTTKTSRGLLRFSRLPFGVNSCVGIFQREIEKVLQGIPDVIVFLDDVLVSGKTQAEHLNTLEKVLSRLESAGLKARADKCRFLVRQVEYLGHVVNEHGISPTSEKTEAIRSVPAPRNVSELKSFLGLLTYYFRYLPARAKRLAPLYDLLKKDSVWVWGPEQQRSFHWAQNVLTSDSVLAHFDAAKEQVLICDASSRGIGAVLAQREGDGSERPVGYVSRSLTASEQKYSQLEREALAIVFAVVKFNQYLMGNQFILVTDHKPLVVLFGENKDIPAMASARIRRWALKLSAYQYTIQFRRTEDMGNADALSRLPLPDTDGPGQEDLVLLVQDAVFDARQVARLTARDPALSRVMNLVQKGGWPDVPDAVLKPFAEKHLELSVTAGVLLWGHRVVIPQKGRQSVISELHAAHPGIGRMKSLARSCVWWPQIDSDLEMAVRRCSACQESRPSPHRADLSMWPWPRRPWSRVHVDFAEPTKGKYIFVAVDAFSKWIEAEPCSGVGTQAAMVKLRRMFARWGLPDIICSDNATTFTSQEFQQFLADNGVQHRTIEPRHSQGNGLAERAVRDVKQALKRSGDGNWEAVLAEWLLYQRKIPHSTTSVSPSELMLGRVIRSRLDLLHPDLHSRVQQKQLQQKLNHDPAVPRSLQLSVGDPVYARNYGVGPSWLSGLLIGVDGPQSYVVKLTDGRIWRRHQDQLMRGIDTCFPTTGPTADVATDKSSSPPGQLAAAAAAEAVCTGPPTVQETLLRSEVTPAAPSLLTGATSVPAGESPSSGPGALDPPVVAPPSESVSPQHPASPTVEQLAPRRSTRVRKQTDFFKA